MKITSAAKNQMNNILCFLGYEINRKKTPSLLMKASYWQIRRLLYFQRLLDLVSSVDGDVVECGVGRGETFYMLCALTALDRKVRNIWGFDSFEGFPEPSIEDISSRAPHKGDWKKYTINVGDIPKMLQEGDIPAKFIEQRINLVKGFFSQSLPQFTGEHIALLHLDVDLYESYKQTLEYFWPKVSVGGVVMFDEYKQPGVEDGFPGAAKAIDQFFGERKRLIQYDPVVRRYYIVKEEEGK
jgi:hypothetical protein